ncbi:MAG: DUF86 domain-containing protein [Chloroflexota bacterium]|nr:DUF86 domain-containing protein [Chloroflexota bacterium]MDE2918994.1 DUF86 domain-containing protein [Chloroflexota bacterium]
MPREESAYLQDILVAAQGARTHVRGLAFSEFTQSRLHQYAVQWELTVMGEAASCVSLDTKVAHPEIPWSQMTGMRNRIVHRYFWVDLDIVWSVVREDLPGLIAQVAPLVPSEAE